jgi:phosphoribosylaminoimidazole-succinocarboxamide synthase
VARGDAFSPQPITGATLVRRGKVRDVYAAGDERYLFVATDRISAFDVVLEPGIPGKGVILTQLSNFWFDLLADVVPSHLVARDLDAFPEPFAQRSELAGRACLVRALRMVPVECVARGYIVGSGWREYTRSGSVCGIPLPDGLEMAERLPEPIFTPATKVETGHDENISFDAVVDLVGGDLAERLRSLTLELYRRAARFAEERGIVIADTKFEFGLDQHGALIWADEALTPDSSRFWPRDSYRVGGSPPSFDKQFVRDWLERSGWDKTPPGPPLPDEVVTGTRGRYLEAYERLTGKPLDI